MAHLPALLCLTLALSLMPAAPANDRAPIRLDARNPHYFSYAGKTVALITSGEHYGAVFNRDFDYRKYLAALAADGLNYTRLFGGSYVEVPGKSFGIQRNDLAPATGRFLAPWARSGNPGYAVGGNKFDLTKWDTEYFDRLHEFLAAAEKSGVIVELTFFSSQYDLAQWKISPLNAANNVNGTELSDWRNVNTLENGKVLGFQESYVRKLVQEASPFPNVIFEIQNEPWSDRPVLSRVVNPYLPGETRDKYPNSVDLADAKSLAWQTRVAKWISSEESSLPKKHLIAQNYSNFLFPVSALIPGVSVVNFHYAYPEAVSLNYGIGKAISYDETGFLGPSDAAYLRQAWNFMLSGGGVFDGLDYSFSVGHEDGTDTAPNGPGGGSPAFRKQLHVLSKFLQQFSLADMKPDEGLIVHASGTIAHALSDSGGNSAVYLDGNGPADITLQLPAGKYRARWMDVRTGGEVGSLQFQLTGGKKTISTPEFSSGIALQLKREP